MSRLSALCVLLSLTLSAPASGFEPRTRAVEALDRSGFESNLELRDVQTRNGVTTVRLGQLYEGLPVLGTDAVVRLDDRGRRPGSAIRCATT